MKTNYFTNRKISIYSLFGFVAFVASSCGSYQNSSYYDSDGIYHDSRNRNNQPTENSASQNTQSNQYKDYFSSLQNDDTQIFTDVDSYNTPIDTVQNNQEYSTGNAGWGDSASDITVNVYGNNWGYGLWNSYYYPYWGYNSWYGPNWGWGMGWYGPGWGLGWNSFYGYPYYGYGGYYGYNGWNHGHHSNHFYSYNGGRRGPYYSNNTRANNSVRNYSNTGRRTYTTTRNAGTRNPTFTRTRTSTAPRSNNSNTTPTRTYTPQNGNVRQPTSTPSRTYTPANSGGTRSSSGSYGGGSNSGGGGRTGGGGGRR